MTLNPKKRDELLRDLELQNSQNIVKIGGHTPKWFSELWKLWSIMGFGWIWELIFWNEKKQAVVVEKNPTPKTQSWLVGQSWETHSQA